MLETETLFPVCDAVEKAINQKIHKTTVHRWVTRGMRGICLETYYCGKRLTSIEAVKRFMAAATQRSCTSLHPTASQLQASESAASQLECELA